MTNKSSNAVQNLNSASDPDGQALAECLSSFIPAEETKALVPAETRAGRPPKHVGDVDIATPDGVRIAKYKVEKHLGIRKSNGEKPLKRLTMRHYKIIGYHLAGFSGEAIASLIGCTGITVSRILRDELSQKVIARALEDKENELRALTGPAIKAIREALHAPNTKLKLDGVDKFMKLRQAIGIAKADENSAEEIVSRVLSGANVEGDVNIQINNG